MSHQISTEENKDYLKVTVTGEWVPGAELEDTVNGWAQVAKAANNKAASNILVIWNVPGYFPVADAYNLIDSATSIGWRENFKTAVVHLHEERFQDAHMGETLAVGAGLNVKVFNNEQEAIQWLLQS